MSLLESQAGRAVTTPQVAIVGNLNIDLVLGPLSHLPQFGREQFVAERSLRSAGQAFNTAVALAALGDAPLLISNVGDDHFGRQILSDLQVMGVASDGVQIASGLPTGLTLALLNMARDRAFVTHPGHLGALQLDAILTHWSAIIACRFLLFCGYSCLPGMRPAAGATLLARARADHLVTVLDTGWDPDDWLRGGREEVWRMLAQTDIFLPNLEEAQALTGCADPEAAAVKLREGGVGTVIVKLGAAGALALQGSTRVRVEALPTVVADTVGAGDSFNAGVLYALGRDWPLDEALALGTAVASYVIGAHELRYPSLVQARALLA